MDIKEFKRKYKENQFIICDDGKYFYVGIIKNIGIDGIKVDCGGIEEFIKIQDIQNIQ